MSTLDDEIAKRVAYDLRTHELKQAHRLLAQARTLMRQAEMHLEAQDQTFADDVEAAVANAVEPIMYRFERVVREREQS